MKNLLIFLLAFILVACADSSSSSNSENNTGINDSTEDTKPEVRKEEPNNSIIELSILSGGVLYFYNGDFTEVSADSPKDCGFRCFTDGNEKVFYGDYGLPIAYEWMNIEPDFVCGDWILEKIDPQTALSLGAQAKYHTRIYYQGSEIGHWSANQWEAIGLFKTVSGDVIAIDQNQGFRPVSSNISNINHAKDLLIYDFDGAGRTAVIAPGGFVSWSTNSFNQADQWLKVGDIWYSWNGYEYEDNLIEYANSMWGWNNGNPPVETSEAPVVIAAGVREEFETVLYWIECNSGWLIRYTPSSDQLTAVHRLYMGDGLRMTGIAHESDLKPVIIGDCLYFNESGAIWRLDLDSGIVQLFFGGKGEVNGW
jgi:hypothetical protein